MKWNSEWKNSNSDKLNLIDNLKKENRALTFRERYIDSLQATEEQDTCICSANEDREPHQDVTVNTKNKLLHTLHVIFSD